MVNKFFEIRSLGECCKVCNFKGFRRTNFPGKLVVFRRGPQWCQCLLFLFSLAVRQRSRKGENTSLQKICDSRRAFSFNNSIFSTIIYQFKDTRIRWTYERAIKVVKSKRIYSKSSFVPWVLLRQGTLDNSFLLQCLFFTMWPHHLLLCPYVPIEEFNK